MFLSYMQVSARYLWKLHREKKLFARRQEAEEHRCDDGRTALVSLEEAATSKRFPELPKPFMKEHTTVDFSKTPYMI